MRYRQAEFEMELEAAGNIKFSQCKECQHNDHLISPCSIKKDMEALLLSRCGHHRNSVGNDEKYNCVKILSHVSVENRFARYCFTKFMQKTQQKITKMGFTSFQSESKSKSVKAKIRQKLQNSKHKKNTTLDSHDKNQDTYKYQNNKFFVWNSNLQDLMLLIKHWVRYIF